MLISANTMIPQFIQPAALCALLLLLRMPGAAAELTADQQMGRDIYRELIETDTSHSVGDTTKAAELLAARFRAAGFADSDVHVIGPDQRNKNLIVRYHGS